MLDELAANRALWNSRKPAAFRYVVDASPRDLVSSDGLPISDAFDLLENAIDEADSVQVEYDAMFHFPSRFTIDWSSDTSGDENEYEIRDFQVTREE